MKSIRCMLSCATRCEHFKSGECMSPVNCKYQMELIAAPLPETIFMPTKEAWKKMQAENSRLTAENAELRASLEKALELPFFQKYGEVIVLIYKDKDGIVLIEKYIEDEYYNGKRGNVAAEARLKEIKEET